MKVEKTCRVSGLHLGSLVLVCAAAIFSTVSVFAQEKKTDQGAKLGNAYSVGEFDTVNTTNGNLMLSFPLGSLPAGRGGATASVSLNYTSKLYQTRVVKIKDERYACSGSGETENCTYYYKTILERADKAGWSYSTTYYALDMEDRRDSLVNPQSCNYANTLPWQEQTYVHKLRIVFPDGTSHEMHPQGHFDSTDLNDKFYKVRYDGRIENCGGNTSMTGSAMTYFSDDGSYLRLLFSYDGDSTYGNNTWTLYFPDGSKVTSGDTSNPQKMYDRNGNYVQTSSGGFTDQFGRSVSTASVKGFNGATLSWTVTTKDIHVLKTYQSCASTCPSYEQRSTFGDVWNVVDTLTEPSQMGGRTYKFLYNAADLTNPASTSQSYGWGEISRIILPTTTSYTTPDAKIDYTYSMDNLDGPNNNGLPEDVDVILRNYPTSKTITHDGETDTWTYSTSRTSGGVTDPNGGVTGNVFSDNQPSTPSWQSGLIFATTGPDGTKVEKIWAQNKPHDKCFYHQSCNPYVKSELTSIKEGSSYSFTTIRDYTYDKNGNVTKVEEYDWIPYSNTRVSGTQDPLTSYTSLSSYKKLITVTSYYYDTPGATISTYDDPESYYLNSNNRNLRLPKSVEIQDGSGNPKSRSEMVYDLNSTTPTTGNLTETKTWDSYKDGSSQSYSNPLTTNNSISTTATYNSYGMPLTTKDARQTETTFTYGGISGPNGYVYDLYPTQTVVGSGSGIALTSTASYDFYTGLVTTATDTDNSVSTVTEYDAVGRPTKVKSAAGSALEVWTTSTYSDTSRYVIAKSDLESVGDGKKVATTFFDQLGRPRLAKTLEDASTQSATNETDGIKVVTKYKAAATCTFDTSKTCSSQVVSNPFRANYSYNAGGESTMGWTLSQTRADGKHSETETFSGAALPKPFLTSGENTATTGKTKTDSDANYTTVEDQASKKRRSLTNAFGQLIRVDEPTTGTNPLGDVTSPNQATEYFYDTLGNMIRVQQGGSSGQKRDFLYSSLGRIIRVRQPEQDVNSNLSLSGHPYNSDWTAKFTYDSGGNILTATDAKNVTTTNTYDAIGRVTQRSYNDSSTPTVYFYYDGAGISSTTCVKGKLTKVTNGVSDSLYSQFDAACRLTEYKQITDSTTYTSSYQYNLSGALKKETYPSGREVNNEFTVNGNIARIFGKPTSSASERTWANAFTYFADGKIDKLRLGNNIWESAKLNARGQVTELSVGHSVGDGGLMKLVYDYGELNSDGTVDATKNAGNIAKQTVTFSGQTNPFIQTYKYDALDRITEALEKVNGTQSWKQTYGYDLYGNRTSFYQKVGSSELNLDSITAPGINSANNRFSVSQGYSYDANGNIIQDTDPLTSHTRQFTFNGDNKQTQVKDVTNSNHVVGTYSYDGDGRRVKKITDDETTIFVYDGMGKLIGEYSSAAPPSIPTINYTATDTLGSPRLLTDKFGQIVARRDFMPFGEELYADGTYRTSTKKYTTTGQDAVRQRFTGYQRDTETGLDFAEARMHNSHHGRFTAVDPLLASGKSADPQSFNRYTYVLNCPTRLTDSSGLQAGDEVIKIQSLTWAMTKLLSQVNNYIKYLGGLEEYDGDKLPPGTEFREKYTKRGPVVEFIRPSEPAGAAIQAFNGGVETFSNGMEKMPLLGSLHKSLKSSMLADTGQGSGADVIRDSSLFLVELGTTAASGPGNRGQLAKNLVEAGAERLEGFEAHHIVAFESKYATEARVILEKAGVGINEAANGVFLKGYKVADDIIGITHNKIHTKAYYNEITRRLQNSNDVRATLAEIGSEIAKGKFPF